MVAGTGGKRNPVPLIHIVTGCDLRVLQTQFCSVFRFCFVDVSGLTDVFTQ